MKKIVGIIAALAMAGAVFAVDIATMIHGWTDLLNMDLKTEGAKPAFLGIRDPWDRQYSWYSTGIAISVNADKCGGYYEINHRSGEVMNSKAWVQPTDAVKITVGNIGLASNTETIDYTKLRAFEGKESWGIDITPVDGLTINTMLTTEMGTASSWGWKWNYWGENGKFDETVAKITYAADFGSVFAMLDYADPVTDISAGYSGNFGGIGIFTDFAYTMKDNDNKLGVDFFVDGHADAFGYKAYVKFERGLDTEVNSLCAKFRGSFALDFGNFYVKVESPDVFSEYFPIQIYPGLEFNIGAASIDAGFQFNMNTDFDAGVYKVDGPNNTKVLAESMNICFPLVYRVVF